MRARDRGRARGGYSAAPGAPLQDKELALVWAPGTRCGRGSASGLARGLVDHVEQLVIEEDAEGDHAGHGLEDDDRPARGKADRVTTGGRRDFEVYVRPSTRRSARLREIDQRVWCTHG